MFKNYIRYYLKIFFKKFSVAAQKNVQNILLIFYYLAKNQENMAKNSVFCENVIISPSTIKRCIILNDSNKVIPHTEISLNHNFYIQDLDYFKFIIYKVEFVYKKKKIMP